VCRLTRIYTLKDVYIHLIHKPKKSYILKQREYYIKEPAAKASFSRPTPSYSVITRSPEVPFSSTGAEAQDRIKHDLSASSSLGNRVGC
jgi:hypothetical protein